MADKDYISQAGWPSKPIGGPGPADCGGVCMPDLKELPYSPPVGPKGQWHNSPGLGGTNHGNKVMQGRH